MINPLHGHAANELVERYIGTAYDNIKRLMTYLPWFDKLNDWLGQPSGIHPPVYIESNAPIVLNGLQTVNGFVVPRTITNSSGNLEYDKDTRVLIKDQTDLTKNGIYVANHLGDWDRAVDFKDSIDLRTGQLVTSTAGGINDNVATWMVGINTHEFEDGVTEIMFSKAISTSGYEDSDTANLNLTNGVRNSVGYKTFNEVRALSEPVNGFDKIVMYGQGGGIYYWDSASTASDDGEKVIKLLGTAVGRYLRTSLSTSDVTDIINSFGLGGTSSTASDIANVIQGYEAGDQNLQNNLNAVENNLLSAIQSAVHNRKSYQTLADLNLITPVADSTGNFELAEVWNDQTINSNGDFVNNGLYGWDGSAWVKSSYDQLQKLNYLYSVYLNSRRLIEAYTFGKNTPVVASGSGAINSAVWFNLDDVAPYSTTATSIDIAVQNGGSITVVVASINTTTSELTLIDTQTVTTVAGINNIPLDIAVPAGAVVGVGGVGGVGLYYASSSNDIVYYNSLFTGTVSYSTASFDFEYSVNCSGQVDINTTDIARLGTEISSIWASVGSPGTVIAGWPNLLNSGTGTANATYSWFIDSPVTNAGDIEFSFVSAPNTTGQVLNVQLESDGSVTLLNSIPYTSSSVQEANTVLMPSVPVGTYMGIKTDVGSVAIQTFSNPEGIGNFRTTGLPTSNTPKVLDASHRFEMNFSSTGSGLFSNPTNVPTASMWPTVVSSSLPTSFETPVVYVPKGTYNLTTPPPSGLWGDGEILVNGQRWFIPKNVSDLDLHTAIRGKGLAETIGNGKCLTLIADSIGHFAYANTGKDHWFDLVSDFINLGVSSDEPIMTALRPSSIYTPDFYGVTYTGVVSTGTTGPIGESLILASGSSLSFTGAYDNVQVFYNGAASAGSLVLSSDNGLNYTEDASVSTLKDILTNAPVHSTATSNFTITASGGSVEITGLVRMGATIPSTGTSKRRLISNRSAHGSYTFNNFGINEVTSILAQGNAISNGVTPLIALGVNDSRHQASSVIRTNCTNLIDNLRAGGVTDIFAILPIRPTSSWDSNYASYPNMEGYDKAVGVLTEVYREKGVYILDVHLYDFAGKGLLSDGLHPSHEGAKMYAQRVIESLGQLRQ